MARTRSRAALRQPSLLNEYDNHLQANKQKKNQKKNSLCIVFTVENKIRVYSISNKFHSFKTNYKPGFIKHAWGKKVLLKEIKLVSVYLFIKS